MRLWTISDLHLVPRERSNLREFYVESVPTIPDADVAVIAGDFTDGAPEASMEWLATHIKPRMPVVAVLGNHDFYGENLADARKAATEAADRFGIHLLDDSAVDLASEDERHLELAIKPPSRLFSEEERSRQPSVMTPIRRLLRDFEGFSDAFLGLYGAFGHDLIFEFDPMPLSLPRPDGERLMHLYLPDRILVMDRRLEVAWAYEFEFERRAVTTVGQTDEAFAPLQVVLDGERFKPYEKAVAIQTSGFIYAAKGDYKNTVLSFEKPLPPAICRRVWSVI